MSAPEITSTDTDPVLQIIAQYLASARDAMASRPYAEVASTLLEVSTYIPTGGIEEARISNDVAAVIIQLFRCSKAEIGNNRAMATDMLTAIVNIAAHDSKDTINAALGLGDAWEKITGVYLRSDDMEFVETAAQKAIDGLTHVPGHPVQAEATRRLWFVKRERELNAAKAKPA